MAVASRNSLRLAYRRAVVMTPHFTLLLIGGIAFALPIVAFIGWRFGLSNAVVFVIVSGGFTALMDFLSAFAAHNYAYPGQSPLWVATYIFFGWIGMCGSCLLIAEGLLAKPGQDLLTQPELRWQVPLLTGVLAVGVDLFIDPIAVKAGYWVWFKEGTVYYGIPLLNFVGWFVLMTLAPLAWLWIVQQHRRSLGQKVALAVGALLPLSLAAIAVSMVLNGLIAAVGWR